MRKALGALLLLGTMGAGIAYGLLPSDREKLATDKLANLVRIAAEGSKASPSGGRSEAERPQIAAVSDPAANPPQVRGPEPRREETTIVAQASPSTPRSINTGPSSRPSTAKPTDDDARRELAKSIQAELKRVGCYDGEMNGSWSPASRKAMKNFIDRINASLPIEEPDYILLTLLQGHSVKACGKGCTGNLVEASDGTCQPRAIIAKSKRPPNETASIATAQTAPTAAELESRRRAELEAEKARVAAAAADEARRKQLANEKAKADAEKTRLAALAAEDARRKQLADEKAKADAEKTRLAALAAEDARRKQFADEKAKTDAEKARLAALAAEDARRKQLADEKAKADAEKARLAALAAENARRKQLADEKAKADAEKARLAALAAGVSAPAAITTLNPAPPAGPAPAPITVAPAPALAVPDNQTAKVTSQATPEAAALAATQAISNAPIQAASDSPKVATTKPKTKVAAAPRNPERDNPGTEPATAASKRTTVAARPRAPSPPPLRRIERRPEPRFVQRFVPPPQYYVGRVVVSRASPFSPSFDTRRVPIAVFRSRIFGDLGRNSP